MMKNVLTETDVQQMGEGGRIYLAPDTIVTPAARDAAVARRIEICYQPADTARRSVAIAADHAGVQMKEHLKACLTELGYPHYDFGTHDQQPVDYPDVAFKVAEAVARGRFWRGIIIDGAGVGSCITANKVPGIRAAACYDARVARNSREHNDANVLTLGAGLISIEVMREIVHIWLSTEVGAERHQKRVEKIMGIERKFLHNPNG